MDPNSNSSVYDTGLPGYQARPVPKPRPRPTPPDERPQVKPIPPPRPDKVNDQRSNCVDSIDNLPFYRKNIEDLIKENRPQKEKFQAACSVMRVQCSLNSKYESIELWDLLEKNKGQDVRKIPQAFTILEKYATNLLKDEVARHHSWSSVQFQSAAYQNKVKFMMGSLDILKSLGYTEEIYNNYGEIMGLSFPPGTPPNAKIILNIAVDLIIAQFEVEAMIMGEHPRANELQTIEDVPSIYFPPRIPVQYIASDINTTERKSIDYALNKTSVSSLPPELNYDVPPPIPPKNNVQILEDYKNPMAPPRSNVTRLSQGGYTTPQQVTCLNCSTKLDVSSKFCSECGSSLKSSISDDVKAVTDSIKTFNFVEDDAFVNQEQGWNCEHCTFLNSYDTNVCAVCYKTSSTRRKATVPSAPPVAPHEMMGGIEIQNHDITKPTTVSAFQSPTELDPAKIKEAMKQREDELQEKRQKEQEDLERRKKLIIEEQNVVREDGLKLVSLMRLAENHGYTVEECLLAQKINKGINEQSLLNWLKNDWLKLIDDVVYLCSENFKNDGTVGAISKEEAKQLLLNMNGDAGEVLKLYSEKRKGLINQLADLEKLFSREYILNALRDAGGDHEKARQVLQKKVLHTFYEKLNKNLTPEQYDILKDANIPPEVKHRMVMAEIGVSWGRAGFVFRLLKKNVPGTTAEILDVIKNNYQYNYEQCVKFFSHECSICEDEFSLNNIYSSHYCPCKLCWDCFIGNLQVNIKEKHIRHLYCPYCNKPDIDDPNLDTQQYFLMFIEQIKQLIRKGELDGKILEIFEEKLFDFHCKKKANFRYCNKCKNGFEWDDPGQKRMQCNIETCRAVMCYECGEDWQEQHAGISCDDFKAWKEANSPEIQLKGISELLNTKGIQCPECRAKYELAKGGCMHFTCIECKFEFCCGCDHPIKRRGQCTVDESCATKGMHSHCPRDCLNFLRDFDTKDLEKLLADYQVAWKTEYPPEMIAENKKVCGMKLQKEQGIIKIDEACGEDAPENMSGLCELHYKEYLVMLINYNAIDPVDVMDKDSLNNVLRRHFKPELEQNAGESDVNFRQRLLQIVTNQIPLPQRKNCRKTLAGPAGPQLQDDNIIGAAAAEDPF